MKAADKTLERDIEAYLKDEVRSRGWGVHKNISDPKKGGTPGLPDQVIILPDCRVWWVECKSPETLHAFLRKRARFWDCGDTTGCSRTEVRQFQEQQKLIDQGHTVNVIGLYDEVDELMRVLETLYT